MTTCIKCGQPIPDGELFCESCGLNGEVPQPRPALRPVGRMQTPVKREPRPGKPQPAPAPEKKSRGGRAAAAVLALAGEPDANESALLAAIAGTQPGGSGTAEDPYQITGAAELIWLRDAVNAGEANTCGTATRMSASLFRRLSAFFGSTPDQGPKAAKFAILTPGRAGFPNRAKRSEGSNSAPIRNSPCFGV